jgi:hypothetical protein
MLDCRGRGGIKFILLVCMTALAAGNAPAQATRPSEAYQKAPGGAEQERGPREAGAQNKLGLKYLTGDGVPQDYAEAAKWFRQAAEQGLAVAQLHLGIMHRKGMGVPRDDAEAAKWYRQAAEGGLANAQYNLGYLHENGQGVAQDFTEALHWYRKAAEQGFPDAENNLGAMYQKGRACRRITPRR